MKNKIKNTKFNLLTQIPLFLLHHFYIYYKNFINPQNYNNEKYNKKLISLFKQQYDEYNSLFNFNLENNTLDCNVHKDWVVNLTDTHLPNYAIETFCFGNKFNFKSSPSRKDLFQILKDIEFSYLPCFLF